MIKLHYLYMQLQKKWMVLSWISIRYNTELATYCNIVLHDVTKRNSQILSHVLKEKPSTESPLKYSQYWCHLENHINLCNVSTVKYIFKYRKTTVSTATLKQ